MPDVHDGHPAPRKLTTKTSKTTRDELYIALAKGTRVVVSGRLKLSRWETPEGEKKSMHVLDVDEVGPSLRFATATVKKMSRAKAGGDGFTPADAPNDAWNASVPAGRTAA